MGDIKLCEVNQMTGTERDAHSIRTIPLQLQCCWINLSVSIQKNSQERKITVVHHSCQFKGIDLKLLKFASFMKVNSLKKSHDLPITSLQISINKTSSNDSCT